MSEIVVRAPGRDKPGYLRRQRRILELQERAQSGMTVATLDQMIEFVVTEHEVQAPEGVNVRDALLDLSQEQWNNLFRATTGGGDDDAVNPPSDA